MATPVIDKPTAPKASYVLLYNVSWEQLEQLDINLQGTGARLTYLDGILEIMSPLSDDHEDAKSTLSRLLEVYLRLQQIRFYIRGSATLGQSKDGTRREPDESYNLETKKPTPDLILEITVTSGGINKSEVYKRLKVPEVWYWEDGVLSVYSLQQDKYEKVSKSVLLPDIDLELLARYSRMADQYDAINEYSQVLLNKST